MAAPLTIGVLRNGLVALQALPIADMQKVLAEKGGNLQDDAVAAEDLLSALAAIGVPYAGEIGAGIAVLAWVIANNKSATPGALSYIPSGRRGSNPWLPS